MDHIAAAEEQLVSERLRRKLDKVNLAAQSHLSGIQDHVNFTLQKAYFKCAYECFDRSRSSEEISNCVEHCSIPVMRAQQMVENEIANFQERLSRSLMVCQDKYEMAKSQQMGTNAMIELESCVDQSVKENIDTLPHLVGRLKTTLSINE